VRPQSDQLVDVDESAHIVVCTFGKDDFVDLEALARVVEIPGGVGSAPRDMTWKPNDSAGFLYARIVYVVREGDGPSPAEAVSRSVCHLNAVSLQDSSSRINRTLLLSLMLLQAVS
jgi:hypothetical protein